MTSTLTRSAQPWVVQPGWGIHVDLTPQELVTTRQVKVLRKLVVSALVAVLLIVAGGWFLAHRAHSAAADKLAAAQLASSQIAHKAAQPEYTSVTQIQSALEQANGQLATLMKGDVLIDKLALEMAAALPKGASYSSLSVSISAAGVNAPPATPSVTPDGGHQRVGSVQLAGTAASVDDVSSLVERLQSVSGLVDVVPTSSTKQDAGVNFQITVGLDDRVLSHRYDVKAGN
jgi:Tfp pilus assembly protein PilN